LTASNDGPSNSNLKGFQPHVVRLGAFSRIEGPPWGTMEVWIIGYLDRLAFAHVSLTNSMKPPLQAACGQGIREQRAFDASTSPGGASVSV